MTQSNFSRWTKKTVLVLAAAVLVACGDFKFTGTPPVDFGNVLVFTESAPQTLTWRNIGTAHDVVGGGAGSPFAPVGTFSTVTVPNNQTVSLQFSFTPQALGPATGEAKLLTDRISGRASSDKVALKGTGVFYFSDGNISIQDTGGGAFVQAVDFGKIPKGTPKTITVFIKNTPPAGAPPGAVTATVNWSRNDQGFASVPPQGGAVVLPANTAIPIPVTFTPADVGVYEDSVLFRDSNGKPVTGIMVKGEGVKPE